MRQKFWSQGTNLGALGALSQKGPLEIFSNLFFLTLWDVNEGPMIAKPRVELKKLDDFPAQCEMQFKTEL